MIGKPASLWKPYESGLGRVEIGLPEQPAHVRLIKPMPPDCSSTLAYANAQIDDYHELGRADFLWRPPLKMKLRARFSHRGATDVPYDPARPYLTGTAGFGFWNDPFVMTGQQLLTYRPTLPRAIWFFYSSPPSDMQLALGVPGWGWKAAVIDCLRPAFFALLPTAPIGVLLMRFPVLYRSLWPVAQAAMNVAEHRVATALSEWHTYEIEWTVRRARFWVDEKLVFETNRAPLGPLGMVIWLDNQSMIVTPTGRIRSGLVSSAEDELLEITDLEVKEL